MLRRVENPSSSLDASRPLTEEFSKLTLASPRLKGSEHLKAVEVPEAPLNELNLVTVSTPVPGSPKVFAVATKVLGTKRKATEQLDRHATRPPPACSRRLFAPSVQSPAPATEEKKG